VLCGGGVPAAAALPLPHDVITTPGSGVRGMVPPALCPASAARICCKAFHSPSRHQASEAHAHHPIDMPVVLCVLHSVLWDRSLVFGSPGFRNWRTHPLAMPLCVCFATPCVRTRVWQVLRSEAVALNGKRVSRLARTVSGDGPRFGRETRPMSIAKAGQQEYSAASRPEFNLASRWGGGAVLSVLSMPLMRSLGGLGWVRGG
jgi:hypothetical protein